MSRLPQPNSSWIKGMEYVPVAPEFKQSMPAGTHGFLVLNTEHGRVTHAVPSWVAGLMCASKSKGRAYGKLVRGKYPSVKETSCTLE